jgi:uncharacterized membrane protein YedE/YeeE
MASFGIAIVAALAFGFGFWFGFICGAQTMVRAVISRMKSRGVPSIKIAEYLGP